MDTHATITTAELARRLGLTRARLRSWAEERTVEGIRLRSCIVRGSARATRWSAHRLRDLGFLATPDPA